MAKRPRAIQHYSPLRYPGGKGRLSGFVQRIFEENELLDGHYVEPYAGGAAVGLSLLLLEYASRIYINDISQPLYLFWKAVVSDTDALCKRIFDENVTVGQWKRQQSILRNFRDHSRVTVAFATFFLNRTNRSGIIYSGGMIGGHDQTGEWKLDARYNKRDLIGRIEAIAAYSNRIRVSNKDAEAFLRTTVPTLPLKSLIFLDPPYYEQGRSLYENHYQPDDHMRLAGFVRKKLRRNWIISYDDHPQIRRAYRGCKKVVYSLAYTAARRYEGSEVMVFSDSLTVPSVRNPLRITE
jgi:DNA adenine methylase